MKSKEVLCKFIELTNLEEEYKLESLQNILYQAYNIVNKNNSNNMKKTKSLLNFFYKDNNKYKNNNSEEYDDFDSEKNLSKSL